jgi:hypothetical protein
MDEMRIDWRRRVCSSLRCEFAGMFAELLDIDRAVGGRSLSTALASRFDAIVSHGWEL